MLPVPFIDYIPKIYKDHANPAIIALCNKIDSILFGLQEEIISIMYMKTAERCPYAFLEEMNFYLNAGFKPYDSEYTKRKKIATAISGHKRRGSWKKDAKLRIDALTGYSASIFPAGDNDDSIELGHLTDDPDYYWSTESGYDGVEELLGTWEVGDFTEYVIAGIFYINCHEGIYTGVLTADQVEQIKVEIDEDIVPAYFRIFLGYVNAIDQFVKYSNGQIN